MIKIYTYQKCSTCKNATQWLTDQGIAFEEHPIKETRPTEAELDTMLAAYDGELRRLFNTSGMDYREMNLKDKLPNISKVEAYKLLRSNGMLVKRPFLLGDNYNAVGFRQKDWEANLL